MALGVAIVSTQLPELAQGERIRIQGRSFEVDATVCASADDELEVRLKEGTGLAAGDTVSILRMVSEDARYRSLAEVDAATSGRVQLNRLDAWRRVQERDDVRVTTHGIPIEVTRTSDAGTAAPRSRSVARLRRLQRNLEGRHRVPILVDLSAGGARFETSESHDPDELLELGFELPEASPVRLEARVVRVEDADDPRRLAHRVAVTFEDLDDDVRARILTWVFAEQARRFRERHGRE